MFARSAESAAEGAFFYEADFVDNAPHSLIDMLTGHDQGRVPDRGQTRGQEAGHAGDR